MPQKPNVDDRLLERLSELARLSPPRARHADLRRKLEQLIDAFAALQEADLGDGDAGPTAAMGPGQAHALRDDVAEPAPGAAHALQNAARSAADCFVVPRVVEP